MVLLIFTSLCEGGSPCQYTSSGSILAETCWRTPRQYISNLCFLLMFFFLLSLCGILLLRLLGKHIYYHLSLSDSDRPMLLVKMLPKLVLFFCGAWRPQTCIPDLQKPGAYHPLEEKVQNSIPHLVLRTRLEKRFQKTKYFQIVTVNLSLSDSDRLRLR